MTNPKPINTAASIKARLLNIARETDRPYQEVLQYFGMERFLYRLGQSPHSDRFVLKGALLFHIWKVTDSRATRDIDILATADNSKAHIEKLVEDICNLQVGCSDGITFNSGTIVSIAMQNQREYEGLRVNFQAALENTRIPMQIDFGFGDLVTPTPVEINYPTLLDFPPPSLHGYPIETVLAEKLHAMVEKAMLNSRVKDYHDVWILIRRGLHDQTILRQALKRTFINRGMKLDRRLLLEVIERYGTEPTRQMLWNQHCRKGRYKEVPQDLGQVCAEISQGLGDFL